MAKKGKINLKLYKKDKIVFDELYEVTYKVSFWVDLIKIDKIFYESKKYTLKDFKNIFYNNKTLSFESLEISLIL